MPAPDCREWIDDLWPLVCQRARRPLGGILLDRAGAGVIAAEVFSDFLAEFPQRPGSWETVLHWLTSRVRLPALARVAEERRRHGDWQLFRDPQKLAWEQNPDFDALRRRSAESALLSRGWDSAAAILERASKPVFQRLGISEEDSRDLQNETLAELTRASATPGALEKLLVFEELPKLFATMIERRTISWLRKVSAQKRRATNPAYTEPLDDPDNAAARRLTAPGTAPSGDSPWVSAGFDRIRSACRGVLTDFEWHLVEVLFVDASHTRGDLVSDAWTMEHLGVTPADSESKRRRRLNEFIDNALSCLGRALHECDL